MQAHHQQHYLKALGIPLWLERGSATEPKISAETATAEQNTRDNWHNLQVCVKNCTACDLHRSRTQTVFGVGAPQADVVVIGEAPGYYEDQQGEPFVGRAGQLLNEMLKAIGFDRQSVFIANVLKCRPPNNRDPKPDEVAQCTPYLRQQIDMIKPKAILAVGRIAAHFLLDNDAPLSRLRGGVHEFNHIPLFVTYHPAYLLRSPLQKRKALDDLYRLKVFIG